MQGYANQLINAINEYDPDNSETVNQLRDLVCWVSDNNEINSNPTIKELLYIASQKMRVFGYNELNRFDKEPSVAVGSISDMSNHAIKCLYQSNSDETKTLDKTQKEVVDLFQRISPRRLLVSAPTSYGKTFLMREIIYLYHNRYKNILLVFPTVALLLENASVMSWFVNKFNLDYHIVKTVDDSCASSGNKIFVFTPERALQLLSSFPDIKIDFFFFDEVYKIDEDYCNDEIFENIDDVELKQKNRESSFLNEDRGKTFRIALYLLSKTVDEYYLAGPNLSLDYFGLGMKRFLEINHITVKEIKFEPTLRITVNAYTTKLKEEIPCTLRQPETRALTRISSTINDKVKDVVSYIKSQGYGQTLLYCATPAKAIEYSNNLSNAVGETNAFNHFPEDFKRFIAHIRKEYDVNQSVDEWSLVQVLKNGFGMHHGKLPKYIQREILEQFNKKTFSALFCTSTIIEGVNTDAQNMIILNSSKGRKKLSQFDIKNIKGRAGRYYHCFVGRVFYMNKELQKIEGAGELELEFATFSDKNLSTIDLDNAKAEDLTDRNKFKKVERDKHTKNFRLPEAVFEKNRTISKENQENLLQKLSENAEYGIYRMLITHSVDVENFLKYRWITKLLNTFYSAGLINDKTRKKFSAVANSYYERGFKGILEYEIDQYNNGNTKSIDKAYNEAFKSLRGILEHQIPKMLSLFESIIIYVAEQKGDDVSLFTLSRVRRYYETGVKSALGEALTEYGFPADAIRRLEQEFTALIRLSVPEAKRFCHVHHNEVLKQFDEYEKKLFEKAICAF